MIMNGTKDPLNPFAGGEVKLFGLLRRGKVRSSRESGQYFADLNDITGAPETNETRVTDEAHVEQVLWRNDSNVEVELMAIHGGGHGMPQPYARYPRLLGPTPRKPNGPAVIWAFFERQRPDELVSGQAEKTRTCRRRSVCGCCSDLIEGEPRSVCPSRGADGRQVVTEARRRTKSSWRRVKSS